MTNVFIKGKTEIADLNKKINLHNGALVVLKMNKETVGIYYVISFRDNKNKYPNVNTTNYCSMVDLDSGKFMFEERCSRNTTVRRVLSHLLRLGYSMPYDPDSDDRDYKMRGYEIDVYDCGNYRIGIELMEIK